MDINKAKLEEIIEYLKERRSKLWFWETELKNSYTTTILTLELIKNCLINK